MMWRFLIIFLGQCRNFSFSTLKQCILSQLYATSLLCFPPKTLYPGGIRTRVFYSWFLRRMRCPLGHAAKAWWWSLLYTVLTSVALCHSTM
jgi:hypothetical protein